MLGNLNELKESCKEEWVKIPSQHERLIKLWQKPLLAVTDAKGGSEL